MKILQIHKFFDLRGGAEVYLHQLINKLRERGHDVHAFSTKSASNLQSADKDYFVTRYNYDRKEGIGKDIKKAINFLWNKEAKQSLQIQINDLQPDVIHLQNIYHHLSTSILSVIRKSGIPCVQTLHDYKLACPNYKMFTKGAVCERCKNGKYYNTIINQCLFQGYAPNVLATLEMSMTKIAQSYERTVNFFLCPSHFIKNKMQEWGEPPGKLIYFPNPVDIPSVVPQRLSVGPYVFIGRLYPEKGIEILIRAVARVPSVRLNIVGEGPERNHLESLAKQIAPNRVNFLGFHTGLELEQIRNTAKAVCMPTLMYENASLSVLESMAVGVPVIASDIGGLSELISDGVSGFLVKPDSIESWIEALNQMESFTPEQRADLGQMARKHVEQNHNWQKHLDELENIYRTLSHD